MKGNIAYHFTRERLRDGSPIPHIGQKLVFPGKIEICRAGYHWSEMPSQALEYAQGSMLHKVQYGGKIQRESDKGVSSERTIIATIDANYLLRRFAADQALSASQLWDMPEITREYLVSLDESIRNAAQDAIRGAFGYTSRAPALSAAWYASLDEAWSAARVAVRAAVRAAARVSEWDKNLDAALAEFDRRVYKAFEGE